MKHKIQIIISASASVLALTALAQDTSNPKMVERGSSRQSMNQAGMSRLNDTAKASDLIGMTVQNYQHEKLGNVENLALDVTSGRVVQVIIASGGFLGMGKTLTPVPPGALHHDAGQKVLLLNASQEKFNAAPKCDTAKWDEETQSNRVSEVYGYYGQSPYFVANPDGFWTTNTSGAVVQTLPRNMDGSINTAGASTMDTVHNVAVASDIEATNNNTSTRNPDGTWNRNDYANGNGANSGWSSLGYVQKASKLMGTSVDNLQDVKLGQVENFIVDLSAGRIVAVIISSGGFMSMDGELSAVPPTAFKLNPEHNALQLDSSKEMLANSPHFKSNEWPDFNQPGYAGGIYRAYRVDPYFNPDATVQPDKTARNMRDGDGSTLTPLVQGNSQSDLDTTAEIHKEINAADGMSMNAKNVKITTLDGHVTLRGAVDNADEKRQIGDIADRIAQSSNVDNQLKVTQTTTSLN